MSGIPAGAGSLLGKRLGKYEILALLALGGTAEIYLARIGGAAGFEKYVVVKCLHDHLADDQEFVKMFLDEARLAACLDHSNVVQTFELGEHENRYYMVMEFLAGLSLAMVIRRAAERLPGGTLPVPLVLNIASQACAGLHYAHERTANGKPLNIVHRDISPQNLVVSFEGVVKVVDFGIAKAELRETQTRSGTIKGKFAYMSPEQCVANKVDRRTDIFALGVIIHELLTGRRLFKRPSPYETYQAVIECKVPSPSQINHQLDPAVDAMIMKSLAKDKEDRYPTAEAFGDALAGYLHHRGKGSGPGEVSRFFDSHFAQEIDEHGARMRELISGREVPPETAASWEEEEEERKKEKAAAQVRDQRAARKADVGSETMDVRGGRASRAGDGNETMELEDSMDLVEVPGQGELSMVIDDLHGVADDALPDRTRIEENPIEKLLALEAAGKGGKAPAKAAAKVAAAPAALKVPSGPAGALTMALDLDGAELVSEEPAAAGRSGAKFPAAANLPTMIVDPEPAPAAAAAAQVRAVSAMHGPGGGGSPVAPAAARTMISNTPDPRLIASLQQEAQQARSHERTAPPPMGSGLPPMGSGLPPMGSGTPPPMMFESTVPSANPNAQMSPGGLPLQPSDVQVPGFAATDPLRAAQLMSPVGDQYPSVIDWSAAAAQPAKAMPPWKLALLFVAAIGVALGLTIVIARLAH